MKQKEFSIEGGLGVVKYLIRYNCNTAIKISRIYYLDGTVGDYFLTGYKARQGNCLRMSFKDKCNLIKMINMLFAL